MIEIFLQLDRQLFLLINHLPHHLIFDGLMSFFSGIGTWGIVWFFLIAILFLWEEVKDRKGFVALILAFSLSFILVDLTLKNLVRRPRPGKILGEALAILGGSNSFSFPSGHSALAFAGAYILASCHKKWRLIYFTLAFLIAFSRIYLGMHYPSDVLAGAIFGLLIGKISLGLSRPLFTK